MLYSNIDMLILFGRKFDLITPLCLNSTYGGLLDELFGISMNKISVKTEIIDPKGVEEKKK